MPTNLQIQRIRLSQMDIKKDETTEIAVSAEEGDLNDYLREVLDEIDSHDKKREFEFRSETTEFFTCLSNVIAADDFEAGKGIVDRLLREEIIAEGKYGHLNKNANSSHVKRGSYLQFVYTDGSGIKYLGVKVDHQGFLDETDLKKRIGLALSEKVYKAVRVDITEGKPGNVDVYDSQHKIALYWWQEFIELTELRSDAFNTEKACEETIKKLRYLKRISEHEFLVLRSATISAFKQEGTMDYYQFVDDTFTNYSADSDEFKSKLEIVVERLKELPEKKNFDPLFTLVPSSIKSRKTSVRLRDEITLNIDGAISDLDEKVWSETNADGDNLVVIKSDVGFGNFKKKERVL